MREPDQTDTPPDVPETGRVLVFDSGMGGLTVAREIREMAPGLAVDYAADTGFFPSACSPSWQIIRPGDQN